MSDAAISPTTELRPPNADTLTELEHIVGGQHAVRDPDRMAPYLTEWRDRYRGEAAIVLKPGSTNEVAAVLKCANAARAGIVPQGGNTGLVGAQIPDESGSQIVLSLERLVHIRDVDLASNTMTVEAGLTLAGAQERAMSVGRLFPLSLASEGSCQIGGVLSTNAGGLAVLAYGNARDLALGLEVVLADGRVWHGLKALRKDNTGYDLKNLFIGAEGTLGVITAAVLRLFPRPAEQVTCLAGLRDLENAIELLARMREAAGPMLTAFEILPRIGLDFAIKHGTDLHDPLRAPHAWYVLLEVSSPLAGETVHELVQAQLSDAIEVGVIEDAVLTTSDRQTGELWKLREVMSEVQKYEGGSIKHDVSVPIGRVPEFIDRANDLVELMIPGARPVPFGHLGDGNIHYNVSQPVGMDKDVYLSNWEALNAAVHEIVLDLGGSISAEHGIGRMKRDLLPHAKGAVAMELMRAIKTSFDPNGILNPGKLI
ncbi:hydroxyacid dehydrogenase [Methyloceanibacter methanicus]|uniref:Hydroxyacid dehydrogenase n=1 Tax=Methyloceanibacter methanicus TaxID=1774968 RepID=A0A1E3W4J2_9HYPH|nr:FAD-binding oxidoreductase [Methyloceanibacter methanicus]ODS00704.1 hydroxyacid dehydrogenase [Methyloceanibacter methanicus]